MSTLFEPVEDLPEYLKDRGRRPILLRYVPMFRLTPSQSRFLAEGLGTFIFVTTYSLSSMNSGNISIDGRERTRNLAPVAIGFVMIVLVLCFGYISGAHFNPAFTLAAVLSRALHVEEAISYWLAQVVGCISGGFFAVVLSGTTRRLPAPQIYRNEPTYIFTAFASEAVFTAVLATLLLHTLYSTQRNVELYAFTIGFAMLSAQYAVGNISGGAFNPAVALGLQIAKFVTAGYVAPLMQLWLYWAAPAVGAVVASLVFQMTHPAPPPEENAWGMPMTGADSNSAGAPTQGNPHRYKGQVQDIYETREEA